MKLAVDNEEGFSSSSLKNLLEDCLFKYASIKIILIFVAITILFLKFNNYFCKSEGAAGVEPATYRVAAGGSTTELYTHIVWFLVS